jgi:CheY-like chemotaxis protein
MKAEPAGTGAADRKFLVMVMDDEEQIRRMTARMLEKMGHAVVLAEDGRAAVEIYKNGFEKGAAPDLVIMDLTIPGGMGGLEAVMEIHAVNPDAKVLVSSGYSTDPVMASFRDHGFCGALVKPYQLRELRIAVKKALAGE